MFTRVPVPTKPLNLSSHGITSTTIELSWAEPDYANGIISGYRIYYMHSNYTNVQMYRSDEYDGPVIEFLLKQLGEDRRDENYYTRLQILSSAIFSRARAQVRGAVSVKSSI